ncbi:MAG TPA: 4'-phosphopantetheinyl transferase superfamily protein [Burkholderiales bacterium]|nr:4'-phosphopantetheinyl transferase superfamily protein [Burkholderiales bacterium]
MLPLPHAEVHLWLFALDAAADTVAALTAYLAPDEAARAGRFRHTDDVRRYRVARGALRVLVGGYLMQSPGSLHFEYGAHGKPGLAAGSSDVDLQFNLSHSGELALAAFCVGHPVGVDLECADRKVDALALAGRYGSPREQAMLQALDPAARSRRFIELWTCKEAWLKASGLGVTAGLAGLDIDFSGARPHIAQLPQQEQGDVRDWSVALFEPAVNHVASVALRDPQHEFSGIVQRQQAVPDRALAAKHFTLALNGRNPR